MYIYIHIPGISCCTFGPQAANYECLYAALMVPILRSWAIYCFCLATGSLPPILGAPLCYPRPVTEQHPHCFRWQPRPRFTDYIELYNLFKYIIIIVYMSICFVCVYIYMTYIQIAYMPCWWIESAQVLYILSVFFDQLFPRVCPGSAAAGAAICCTENPDRHLGISGFSFHTFHARAAHIPSHPIIVFNTSHLHVS